MDYKDIMNALYNGKCKNKAYKVIHDLQEQWTNEYEKQMVGTNKIPRNIFIKNFPNCKSALKKGH